MNIVRGIVLTLVRILAVDTTDIVSEEKDLASQRDNDHIQYHPEGTERRIIEDVDDKDWHVMHLKDIDFDLKNDCKEETFIDRVNRYRKTLKEDGSLVEYVSADALPVSEVDLAVKKCVAGNITEPHVELKKERIIKLSVSGNVADQIVKNTAVINETDTATTADLKTTFKQNNKNATDKKSRRASEYQFSSDEYYEDVDEFDDYVCPDFMDVIHLEIDTLRSYDVECEAIVEWRSLE